MVGRDISPRRQENYGWEAKSDVKKMRRERGENHPRLLLSQAEAGECCVHSLSGGSRPPVTSLSPSHTPALENPTYLRSFSYQCCRLPLSPAGVQQRGLCLGAGIRGCIWAPTAGGRATPSLRPQRRGVPYKMRGLAEFPLRHPKTIYNSGNCLLTPAGCHSSSSGLSNLCENERR